MTREEAERAAEAAWKPKQGDKNVFSSYVRMFEALGILKLDEPVSVEDAFNIAWRECPTAWDALAYLKKQGFKITR